MYLFDKNLLIDLKKLYRKLKTTTIYVFMFIMSYINSHMLYRYILPSIYIYIYVGTKVQTVLIYKLHWGRAVTILRSKKLP